MSPLIDNYYLTSVPTSPLYATGYCKSKVQNTLTSSIIFNFLKPYGLNVRIYKLLDEYSILQDNWDEEDAKKPSAVAIHNAKIVTTLLERHGQSVFHSAPGPNGEVMLDLRNSKKSKSLEIIFYPTKSVIVSFPETGIAEQQNFEISELPKFLDWLNSK